MAKKTFEDNSGASDVLAGYSEAARLAPIDKPDVEKVLRGYKLTLGGRKNKTDAALYRESVNAVIAWHKQRTADAAKAAAAASQSNTSTGAAPGSGGGATPGSGGNGGAGSPGTYAPSYAGGGTGYQLRYPGGGSSPGMSNTSVAQRPTAPKTGTAMAKKPVLMNQSQITSALRAAGAPLTWKPPAYALVSREALVAWINRAKRQAGTPSVARKPVTRSMPRGSTGTRNTTTTPTPVRRPAYRTITR